MTADKYQRELAWWCRESIVWGQAHMLKERDTYYAEHLQIAIERNCGRLLDVGSGPVPYASHLCFEELFCLDPLLPEYADAGFLFHFPNVIFLPFHAENMWGVADHFFDTVVSVNALDHVDDFEATVREIERVAKPDALIRLRMTYHPPTKTEPMELNDERVRQAFQRFVMVRLTDEPVHGQVLWGN